jgi:hypothetical protein
MLGDTLLLPAGEAGVFPGRYVTAAFEKKRLYR